MQKCTWRRERPEPFPACRLFSGVDELNAVALVLEGTTIAPRHTSPTVPFTGVLVGGRRWIDLRSFDSIGQYPDLVGTIGSCVKILAAAIHGQPVRCSRISHKRKAPRVGKRSGRVELGPLGRT